ncbi:hypothetical protein [Rhizobium leguminosarum]|uniref:Tetratricopeptide repeat protein n=1 Tax=Rhizobium leguminosarum TaxID=384 RepID=A0A2Z4Y9C1_RHILE|nr:hypothetical protein [Rhizobium leguminosarum]AXA37860.1 hypothetical protein DLJ82_0240 [Rhizobium leguminosarum]
MSAEGREAATCDVAEAEAREELERLLSDTRFHATERSRCILRYIAERHFDGHEDGVKAYSIAIDVLGRPSSFDPSTDPIVRIEASRLRSSLSQYYEAFGEQLGVAIHLPKGRYVAVFNRSAILRPACADQGEEVSGEDDTVQRLAVPPGSWRSSQDRRKLAATGILAAVVAISATLLWLYKRPQFTERPIVVLSISAADAALQGEADLTGDYLLTALSQFRTLTISSQRDIRTGSLSSSLRPSTVKSYDIDLKYYGDTDDRSIWWQVVDARSGDVLKSGVERVKMDGKSAGAVRDELVGVLARRFATPRGIINNLEIHDDNEVGAFGNTCILRAEYQLDEGSIDDVAAMLGCLEQTVAAQPGNSDAAATLSRALLASLGGVKPADVLQRSLTLANRAVSLAPTSDRANIALMQAQFYNGRTEAAISAGNRALALNPNNPDVSARLAAVLFASGFWDAGTALADDAAKSVDAIPRDASLVLALDAYRRGDWSEASLLAEQINCGDFLVRALRAAALGQLGSSQAIERLDQLRQLEPGFETAFVADMTARRFEPKLTASIEQGLVKAGARMDAPDSPNLQPF